MYVRDTHSSMNEKRFIGIVRKCLMIDNNRFTIKKRGEKRTQEHTNQMYDL
jgi:hypothetical protein